ncbi:MAG: TIGR03618 family F420-dependent PPOX class oxidoreductase [Anaerolineales bacterium]|nr:TIGR03618 family F420-dependent PPOX class oxidoreductase [Anaerolineales bacterium]
MKINIVGGGPAGLYFALLMKKLDRANEVHVFERDPAHNTYGWGIVLSQRTVGRLRGADFESYLDIEDIAESWEDVDVVHRGEMISVGGNDFFGVERIRFLNVLQERARELDVNLHFETDIQDVDSLRDADLLVGADGLKSTVRQAYRDEFRPQSDVRKNKYVWYGTPQRFNGLTMMFKRHPDGLYIAHAYRFRPDMSTFIVECDPATWSNAGFGSMGEEEAASYLAEVWKEELDGQPLRTNRSLWYNFDLIRNTHWYFDNVVLIGDALHSVHFSIGSGTKLAVEDAIWLAGTFAENDTVSESLKKFEKQRKLKIDAFQDAALDSLLWLEEVDEYMDLEPLGFTYELMTRSNRITHRRLKDQDPEFLKRYEAWRREHEGPIHHEFLDLFEKKSYGHLATLLKGGQPHVTPVWASYDGEHVLVNSAKGRQKDLNMRRRRKVAIDIVDPDNPNRYVGVRGEVVEITQEGADEHLDELAQRYLERDRYPPSWRFPGEIRQIYKIKPDRVVHWDPFGGW